MILSSAIHVRRSSVILAPDQSRVLLRPFTPGGPERMGRIIARILSLSEAEVGPLLDAVSAEFSGRHKNTRGVFLERYGQVHQALPAHDSISEQRRLLIGSYFL